LLRDSYFCELLKRAKDENEIYDIIRNEEERRH
jgi:hypothetical protein